MTTSHTLTGDLANILGEEIVRSAVVTIDTNLGDTPLVDLDANVVRLPGATRILLDENMAFTASLIASDSLGTNVVPGDLQWRVRAQYRDAGGAVHVWSSGYFEITADLDLSDALAVDFVPPEFASDALDQMRALLAEQIDLSAIATPDALVEGLIKNTAGAGPLTSAALSDAIADVAGALVDAGVPPAVADYLVANLTDEVSTILAGDPDIRTAMIDQINALIAGDLGLVHTTDARLPRIGKDGWVRYLDALNNMALGLGPDGIVRVGHMRMGTTDQHPTSLNRHRHVDSAGKVSHDIRPDGKTVISDPIFIRKLDGRDIANYATITRTVLLVGMGQSNNEGQAKPYSARVDAPRPDILMWDWSAKTYAPLTVPMSSQHAALAGMSVLNVAAKETALALGPGVKVAVLNAGVGSSGLVYDSATGRWDISYTGTGAGPALWPPTQTEITAALAKLAVLYPGITPEVWFYWAQGESDGGTAKATYLAAYEALIDAARAHVGDTHAPWTAGGMVPEWMQSGHVTNVRPALIAAQSTRKFVAYVDGIPNGGGSADPLTDEVHYARDGVVRLGKAMWAGAQRACVNDDTSAIAGSIPHEPLDVTARYVGGTLTASWSFPSCRITEFVAQYRIAGGAWVTVDMTTAAGGLCDTTFTVTGLSGAVAEVQVAGKNAAGTSDYSTPVYAQGA